MQCASSAQSRVAKPAVEAARPPSILKTGLAVVLMAVCLPFNAAAVDSLTEGSIFPSLSDYELEGTVPSLEGKVVLIDFWASWCAPCKKSFPALDAIYRKYAPEGFELVAVSVDDKAESMQRFLKANPVSFSTVRDVKKELVADVKVKAMPTSFLVDRQGKVQAVHNGYHGGQTEDQLRGEIEALLGKRENAP
jgi:thiol-disulfide isomerase/thioredoxin